MNQNFALAIVALVAITAMVVSKPPIVKAIVKAALKLLLP